MKVVAYQGIGQLGDEESKPAFVQWQWAYYLPSLLIWLIVGLLLVVPKANRNRQAWLILIPPVLVITLWPMPFRLMPMPAEFALSFGLVFVSLAKAWTVVWLIGHWLARLHPLFSFLLTLAVMPAVGALCFLGEYGAIATDELLRWSIAFGILPFVLLAAMALSRFHCRKRYGPRRFMVWLLLWTVVPLVVLIGGTSLPSLDAELIVLLWVFLRGMIMALFLAGMLYLVNLPFMILAFKSPFYRERFLAAFRLSERRHETLGQPTLMQPATGLVRGGELAGRWEFYLDELAKTVVVDLRPDGTFTQTIVENQGGIVDCPGGTWRPDGAAVHLTGYVTTAGGMAESRTWQIVETPSGPALLGGDDSDPDSLVRLTPKPRPTELPRSVR